MSKPITDAATQTLELTQAEQQQTQQEMRKRTRPTLASIAQLIAILLGLTTLFTLAGEKLWALKPRELTTGLATDALRCARQETLFALGEGRALSSEAPYVPESEAHTDASEFVNYRRSAGWKLIQGTVLSVDCSGIRPDPADSSRRLAEVEVIQQALFRKPSGTLVRSDGTPAGNDSAPRTERLLVTYAPFHGGWRICTERKR
jgi:hypothetical protein